MVILQTYAAVPISCKNSGAKSAPFAHSIVVCVDPYWMNLSLSNNSPNTSPVRYGFKSTFFASVTERYKKLIISDIIYIYYS